MCTCTQPHTYCHDCLKDLHDYEIDQEGCNRRGFDESYCRKCIREYDKLDAIERVFD